MSTSCDFKSLLETLQHSGAKFVVIGGVAAVAHGQTTSTLDLDICYSRDPENLKCLSLMLNQIHAYPRGVEKGLKFKLDERTLKSGLNFTFDTDLGPFDLLGEVAGVGLYEDAVSDSRSKTIYGVTVQLLALRKLISAKRAAGRPKDIAALQELEILLKLEEENGGAT
jgi:predicted nucleotidyltransferase